MTGWAVKNEPGTDNKAAVSGYHALCKNEVIFLAQLHLHRIAMRNIYRSLLLILVGATQKELARQVRYLKVENQVLRSKLPYRVPITSQERNRLVRFAAKLGTASTTWCRSSTRYSATLDSRGSPREAKKAGGSRQAPHRGANPSVDPQAGP